jgi:hypothetical protein
MVVNGYGIADVVHALTAETEVLGENPPSVSYVMIHIELSRID